MAYGEEIRTFTPFCWCTNPRCSRQRLVMASEFHAIYAALQMHLAAYLL